MDITIWGRETYNWWEEQPDGGSILMVSAIIVGVTEEDSEGA